MSDQDARTAWEQHYSAKPQVWSGKVNARLAEIASQLPAGRALDLGCGEGADAIWLAERGWSVTAVDVSSVALERARTAAGAAGLETRIQFTQADLDAGFPSGSFDLISAQFLHSPVVLQRQTILRSAAHALAPGGSLLIVDHAEAPPWATKLHHHDFPSAAAVLADLALDPAIFGPVRSDRVDRAVVGPDGVEVTLADNVILVRRLA